MTIAEKITRAKNDYDAVYEAGKQAGGNTEEAFEAGRKAEYDAFWDTFQRNQTSYAYGFAGKGWDDTTFKPKYDIVTSENSASNHMFATNQIVNLEKILTEQGIQLDVSQSARVDYLFYYCTSLEIVPVITVGENCTNIAYMFNNCTKLKCIKGLILPNKSLTNNNAFNNCTELEDITIGGTIAMSGLDFKSCTKLTKASITSIINALSTSTSGLTITFSKTAKEAAFTSAEWTTLENTKSNWTISLV